MWECLSNRLKYFYQINKKPNWEKNEGGNVMLTLEKIDQVVERTGVTYEEARQALNECGGDVIDAIIYLEKNQTGFTEKFASNVNDKKTVILEHLKELVQRGNVTRVIVKNEERVLLNIPIYIGAAGVLFATQFSLIAAAIAMVAKYAIIIQTDDKKEYNLSEMTEEGFKNLKGKMDNSQISKKFSKSKKDFETEMETIKEKAEEAEIDIISEGEEENIAEK